MQKRFCEPGNVAGLTGGWATTITTTTTTILLATILIFSVLSCQNLFPCFLLFVAVKDRSLLTFNISSVFKSSLIYLLSQ